MGSVLTHVDSQGKARMVDVTEKAVTLREAVASGKIRIGEKAFKLIMEKGIPKGDVFAVARVAGIMAAKKVDDLIPLCHPLPLHSVEVDFIPDEQNWTIGIKARVKTKGVTGVEMEALTAVSVAALTIYDMCKSVDKDLLIHEVRLEYKSGGKSGTWMRKEAGG